MRFEVEALTHPEVLALLDLHLRAAHENSPPGTVFALGLDGLRDPAVTMWSAWDDEALLGIGALKEIGPRHGEIKSMRTMPDRLRRGVGAAMLEHLLSQARARGYARVSLETGGNDAFAAARAMYLRFGFTPCGPFADYVASDFNRFYALDL